MSDNLLYSAAIKARAQAGLEAERRKAEPLTLSYFKASTSAVAIAAACATEMFSMTVALKAQFPTLSDGSDLGQAIMPMRYAIIACLLLGHVVLRGSIDHFGRPVSRVLSGIGVVPILGLLGGMAMFMFAATAQTTGGDDGQGLLAGFAGPALGIVCGALFSLSFLASHVLAGKFLEAFATITSGWAQRAKIAGIERALKAADKFGVEIEACRQVIADMEKPDALHRKAAMEAAGIVGIVAAEAHELHASRENRGDVELGPYATSDAPDLPLALLDRLQENLKQYTVEFFLNQLKSQEV